MPEARVLSVTAWFRHFERRMATEIGQLIESINIHPKCLVSDFVTFKELFLYIRIACRRQECWQHILMVYYAVQERTRFDLAGPADEARHAPGTFLVGVFLAAEEYWPRPAKYRSRGRCRWSTSRW